MKTKPIRTKMTHQPKVHFFCSAVLMWCLVPKTSSFLQMITPSFEVECRRNVILSSLAVGNVLEEAPSSVKNEDGVNLKFSEHLPCPGYGRQFPQTLIVDQQLIKKALILASINSRVGGVVMWGGKGTGKSVMARSMRQLMPPIRVVKGSTFNIDPEGKYGIDDCLKLDILHGGAPLEERETDVIPCPFVQVPLNIMEDRLIGSVDIEESLKQGRTVFSPGILATAHRGILFVDDINLLDYEITNILLNAVKEGFVTVEREGVSMRYPCRPLLIATFNPEEGELKDHFLDRIGISLSAESGSFQTKERVQVVDNVFAFMEMNDVVNNPRHDGAGQSILTAAFREETDLTNSILFGRELVKDVEITHSQIQYLCEEAVRAGVQGHRGDICATEIAKANAILEGRIRVNAADLKLAVQLAIAPRGRWINTPNEEDGSDISPPSSQLPTSQLPTNDDMEGDSQQEQKPEQEEPEDMEEHQHQEDESESSEVETAAMPDIPKDFMFASDATPMDPKLIQFANLQRRGKGKGRRNRIFSNDRGRYVKPIFPHAKGGRIAVAATLRAAAPYQKGRRKLYQGTRYENRRVHIDTSDIRIKKLARKAGSLVIFVVDASGSMALNRMNAAKGSAISLLSEAYQCRDQISLISFRGKEADVLLPPTKSITLAKRRLEQLPCGGGSPLAHALQLSMIVGMNAVKKSSGTLGKVIVVLISDGRANIPLCESLGDNAVDDEEASCREYIKDEVLVLAKKLGCLADFNLLCIDTENKYLSTGLCKEIAMSGRGRYFSLPKAVDSTSLTGITKHAMKMNKDSKSKKNNDM